MIKLFFMLLLMIPVSQAFGEGFILDSLPEAKQLSESTGKPILLIFGSTSCPHCHHLKDDLLSNKISGADQYILCYLNTNQDLKKEYSISMIPDSRIISKNKEVRSIKGYERSKYEKWLKNDR